VTFNISFWYRPGSIPVVYLVVIPTTFFTEPALSDLLCKLAKWDRGQSY